ncbi:histidine kinase [Streptomyces sp. NPDC051561]|uniref:sensor histidine kinase n=1 Tax=Streptomyces sp. NPDC051561 TaxID=3365658 RepID=UPI0037955BBD
MTRATHSAATPTAAEGTTRPSAAEATATPSAAGGTASSTAAGSTARSTAAEDAAPAGDAAAPAVAAGDAAAPAVAAGDAATRTAAKHRDRTRPLPPIAWLLLVGGPLALVLLDWTGGLYWADGEGLIVAKVAGVAPAVALVVLSPRLGSRALPRAAGVLALVSLCISVLLHFRMSVGSMALGFAEPACLGWLLLETARRGKPSWAAPAALLLCTAIVLRPVSVNAKQSTLIVSLLYALGAVTALGIGLGIRLLRQDRRRQAAALKLEQRAEFARDLHDFVAHHVTGIVVQAQGAQAVADRRPELVPPALRRIEQAGSEALTSMRHMVGMLRAADGELALTPLAGIGELRALVEEFSAVGGARAHLALEGTFDDLPVEVTTTAHRVVMEALTNVRKHAQGCTEVRVRVERSGERLTVRVSDDGRSRHASGIGGSGGFGLKGLAERVDLIGGTIQAGPTTGGGWGVEASLPVAPAGVAAR